MRIVAYGASPNSNSPSSLFVLAGIDLKSDIDDSELYVIHGKCFGMSAAPLKVVVFLLRI